ncbi:MAG: hypothetical protein RLZZ244_1626 [Verrucomicrobiota bacterium]|jgi:hypothetical protein
MERAFAPRPLFRRWLGIRQASALFFSPRVLPDFPSPAPQPSSPPLMSLDLDNLDLSALRARVSELRRYL